MNRTIMTAMGILAVIGTVTLFGCSSKRGDVELTSLEEKLSMFEAMEKVERDNLANFDDLDFRVYSGQKWDDVDMSHSKDIIVHWPDGRTTKGLKTHIEDLKGMFVFAPDTNIKSHPIKIASGEWTAVMGYLEGTFSEPMPIGNGRTIPPTGKAFNLPMVTIGHWKNGVMIEEWLMWDNQAFMKQIGLAE